MPHRITQIVDAGWSERIREKTGLIPDAYFSASKIEWILDDVEGAREAAEADFDGWSEQIYVFEGRLTLVIETQEHVLAAGDFYSFASNRMHAYRNDGDVATRFVRNVVI